MLVVMWDWVILLRILFDFWLKGLLIKPFSGFKKLMVVTCASSFQTEIRGILILLLVVLLFLF